MEGSKQEDDNVANQSRSKQLSYKVFMTFVGEDGNAERILSKDCYDLWVSTRKCKLKQPEESFRRVLTAHVGGLDGRRPFPEVVEKNLLKILRKREVWECFRGTGVSIGSRGYRNSGYHESQAAKKMVEREQQNQAINAYNQRLQMQLWQMQQQQQQQQHYQSPNHVVYMQNPGMPSPYYTSQDEQLARYPSQRQVSSEGTNESFHGSTINMQAYDPKYSYTPGMQHQINPYATPGAYSHPGSPHDYQAMSLSPTQGASMAYFQPSQQQAGFVPQQQGFIPQQPGFAPQQQGFEPQQQGFTPQQQGIVVEQTLHHQIKPEIRAEEQDVDADNDLEKLYHASKRAEREKSEDESSPEQAKSK